MKRTQVMLVFAFIISISNVNINAWQLVNGSQYYDIEYKFLDVCDPNDIAGARPQEYTGFLKSGGATKIHTFCGEYNGTNPWGIPSTLAVRRYGVGSSVTAWWKEINCDQLRNEIISYVANHQNLKHHDPKSIEVPWIVVEDGSSWKIVLDWNRIKVK